MAYQPKDDAELGLSLGAVSQVLYSLGKRLTARGTEWHENDLAIARRNELIQEEQREMTEKPVTMPTFAPTGNPALDAMMASMMQFMAAAQAAQAATQPIKRSAINNVSATIVDGSLVLTIPLDVEPNKQGSICQTQGTSASSGEAVRTYYPDGLPVREDGRQIGFTLTVFYGKADSVRPYAKTSPYWSEPRGARKGKTATTAAA